MSDGVGVFKDRSERVARRLYAVLTDGANCTRHGRPLRYNVKRTWSVRDRATRQPVLSSFTNDWRPARWRIDDGAEVDRAASWGVLLAHLAGKADVAIEAPSWTSLVVLDIDRPAVREPGDPSAELAASAARDRVLASVWRAFGWDEERQPVVLRTPGDGYHVYLPLLRADDVGRRTEARAWPARVLRAQVEGALAAAGLSVQPGRLEVYPTGVPLRAPCGQGMALLVPRRPDDPDDLGLEVVGARWCERRARDGRVRDGRVRLVLVRDVDALVGAFLGRVEGARRPLEQWLGAPGAAPPAWHVAGAGEGPSWGPWGKKPPRAFEGVPRSQHNVEVQGGGGARSGAVGVLLHGAAFRRRITDLILRGITEPGTRHDSVLKLAWYLSVQRGMEAGEALSALRDWLSAHDHDSRDLARGRGIADTLREAKHYLRRLETGRPRRGAPTGALGMRRLQEVDRQVLAASVSADVLAEAEAIAAFLAAHAGDAGVVAQPVNLSTWVVLDLLGGVDRRVRGRRRAHVVAMEEMEAAGLLTRWQNHSEGNHGRLYCCWYRWGSGVAPRSEDGLGLVLGARQVAEGELCVVAGATRGAAPRPVLRSLRQGVVDASGAWWRRMFERRRFSPGEFFGAEEERIVPLGRERDTVTPGVRSRWCHGVTVRVVICDQEPRTRPENDPKTTRKRLAGDP